MELVLNILRYQDRPVQSPQSTRIGAAGGTIGRNSDNTLVLPDPERWVGRQHATIAFRDGTFFLTDASKNGTSISSVAEPLSEGQEAKLRDGDELSIGAYTVGVAIEGSPPPPVASPDPAPVASPDPFAGSKPESDVESYPQTPSGAAAPDIMDLVGETPAAADPLSEQNPSTGPADWLLPEEPQALGSEPPAASPATTEPNHTQDVNAFYSPPQAIPDDYDILADESSRQAAEPNLSPEAPESPVAPAAPGPVPPGGGPGAPVSPTEPNTIPHGDAPGASAAATEPDTIPHGDAPVSPVTPDTIPPGGTPDAPAAAAAPGPVPPGGIPDAPAAAAAPGPVPPGGIPDAPAATAAPGPVPSGGVPGAPVSPTEPDTIPHGDASASPVTPDAVPPGGTPASPAAPGMIPPGGTPASPAAPGMIPPGGTPVSPAAPGMIPPGGTPVSPAAPTAPAAQGAVPPSQDRPREPRPIPAAAETEILQAFLAGLGTGALPTDRQAQAQLMRTTGLLIRAMAEGLMRVLMGRTNFKNELHLEMTTIRSTKNNPFKFSVDPEHALSHLLFEPSRGFLSPLEATDEAFDDIQCHEIALVAGLRAALHALLKRMEPAELEGRFSSRSIFDSLPMARKAKCWDLFTAAYQEISADAADDFMNLFRDAFTHAYEEQAARLRQARSGRRSPTNEQQP